MSNSSIFAAFERMWQHFSNELSTKAEAIHDHGVFALPLIVSHKTSPKGSSTIPSVKGVEF